MKTALVTGASKGIGLAISKQLINDGYLVYGVGRTEPNFDHPNFHFIQMDLLKTETFELISETIPKLDVLINNAGVGYFRPLENLRESEIEEMIDLNLKVPVLLTKCFIPKLKESNGHVINIGSQSALVGEKLGTAYCASKFGLRGFSESLFAECRKQEIKVTMINPGMVKSSFFDDKDFAPEDNEICYVLPEDVAEIVSDILQMRTGSVVKEISVFPQKSAIQSKKT